MFRIADAHSDFAGFNVTPDQYGSEYDHADLDRMEKGGIALQIFAACVQPGYPGGLANGLKQLYFMHSFINCSKGRVILCTRKEHLSKPGIKAVLAVESGETIDCRTDMIEHVFGLGARMMSLTWNAENDFAHGALSKGGLKPKGIEAIKELTKLRMALDLSHINEQGFWEATEIYKYPPCASHSCVYELRPNPRNLLRSQIEYIISCGGFIGINFYAEFLKGIKASISDIMRHMEYILSLGGQHAVGFGSDFCGAARTPEGLDSVADFQKLPEEMARRNYNDTLISQICYGNLEKYILKFL
ncbi:MAG: dipeptidase [Burkholderiales bacterium]